MPEETSSRSALDPLVEKVSCLHRLLMELSGTGLTSISGILPSGQGYELSIRPPSDLGFMSSMTSLLPGRSSRGPLLPGQAVATLTATTGETVKPSL